MAVPTSYSREGIKISDVRLLNPPSSWKNDPKFQIVIKYGSDAKTSPKTAFRKGDPDCVIWNDSFNFNGKPTDDTLLTFTVVRAHRVTPDNTIGSCKRRAIDLLKIQSSSGPCKLDIAGKCQLTFNIEKLSDVVSEVVEEASAALVNLPNLEVPAEASNFITSVVQVCNDQDETWTSFLLQFQVFMKVIDDVSEISPYVKIAWSILSVIPKVIITQKNRDDKVKQLCIKLKDTYDYITDAKRLRELTTTQYKIGKAESPLCMACEMEREDVTHYLMKCPRYDVHRLKMQQHYRQHIIPKKTLLASPKAMKFLFQFVNNTKRFKNPYGSFDEPKTRARREVARNPRERSGRNRV